MPVRTARKVGYNAVPEPDTHQGSDDPKYMRAILRQLSDYLLLLRSGVFMHSAYSRRYLSRRYIKPELLSFLALPHYISFGERRGYLPNPFFDPGFLARKSPTVRLADYLRDPKLWPLPLSNCFDGAWYKGLAGTDIKPGQSPLEHFWKTGFQSNLNPTPRFETLFFRRAIARDARDKREYAYQYLSEADPAAPLNSAELTRVQQRFYDSIKLEILKYSESPTADFLLFVQAGRNFPTSILRDAPFDVLINFYDQPAPAEAQYIFRQQGTKITAIRKIIESFPDLFLKYRAVLFLDDDVELSLSQIGRLFEAHADQKLDLLQASLSATSSCFYPTLKQPMAGRGLRHLTGIEIMMPLLSRRVLQTCSWVFKESISGWGIDILLSAEVRKKFGNSIALLGDVVAVHSRPTDRKNNEFYRFLSRHGINPTVEAGHITLKFGLRESPDFIYFDDSGSRV